MLATKIKFSDENSVVLESETTLRTSSINEIAKCPIELSSDGSDIKKPASPLVRGLLMATGTLSLATGIIGIFVPVLPTTCFLLFAAWCYARSSQKSYDRLMNARYIGKYLKNYRDGKGVAKSIKIASISLIWISISYAALVVVSNAYIQILLLAIAAGVTWHIATIPTLKQSKCIVAVDETEKTAEPSNHVIE